MHEDQQVNLDQSNPVSNADHNGSSPDSAEPKVHIQSYWRFRDLLEAAPDGILEVEHDGTIVLLNAAAERMFGYLREELLGQLVEVLIPDSLRQRHQEHRHHYAEHPVTRPMGTGLELFARCKDGTQLPVEISLSPIRAPQGPHVIAIVRDITSRKQADARINAMNEGFTAELAAKNQQLEIRNREVERANRLKSEFLASMSHELRTPLHTIIGFADLLAEQMKGPLNADQKRFVTHIQRDSRHLLELINDILDLSKIESGHLELHPELFKVAEAIMETTAGLRPLAADKQIRIEEILDPGVNITADRLRFKEILYNLVSNAIKFTPPKGHITIECERRPDCVFFAVTDTGIGIVTSELEAIFDKFYQLGSTTRGVREGTGLGLAITKSLVEMHGGRVWVDSTPGAGSRFQFTIPITSHVAAEQGPHVSGRGVVLLVGMEAADDLLGDFLGKKGYGIASARTSQQALELMLTLKPAAVVLDLHALEPGSWAAFQDIPSKGGERVPLLVMTTAPDQDTAASLGASAVLMKPVQPASLLRVIEEQVRLQPGEPARILVVDDEAEVRELLDEALRSAGLLPMLAATGKEALAILARSRVAAVVVDLVMPQMSGFELILRIRQNPRHAELPIIVLTPKEIDQEATRVLSRQADTVFFKASPWKEDFLTKIYELLEQVTHT